MDLLEPGTVAGYLAGRGLVADPGEVRVTALGGGVSNIVLAVQEGERAFVLKQSLPRLHGADEWFAPRERVLSEAAALDLAGRLTPGEVPRVLHVDAERMVVLIEHAPPGWRDWKQHLMAGEIDLAVAARLGETLARWQNATAGGAGLDARFADPEPFELLRVDPYHRTVMARLPEHAARIGEYVERMVARRHTLVHGDFSPKNVLVGPGRQWVIDWEVAHLGDPAFDPAFVLSHLLLKAVHRPDLAGGHHACARAFAQSYETAAAAPPGWDYVGGHVGCLLLARVAGKSPAEYLTAPQRETVLRLGARLLAAPDELWSTHV